MPLQIRKLIVQVDETRLEMGRPVDPPTRRALAMAVIANPCAGRYVENLDALVAIGEELGGLLGQRWGAERTYPTDDLSVAGVCWDRLGPET